VGLGCPDPEAPYLAPLTEIVGTALSGRVATILGRLPGGSPRFTKGELQASLAKFPIDAPARSNQLDMNAKRGCEDSCVVQPRDLAGAERHRTFPEIAWNLSKSTGWTVGQSKEG